MFSLSFIPISSQAPCVVISQGHFLFCASKAALTSLLDLSSSWVGRNGDKRSVPLKGTGRSNRVKKRTFKTWKRIKVCQSLRSRVPWRRAQGDQEVEPMLIIPPASKKILWSRHDREAGRMPGFKELEPGCYSWKAMG